MNSQNNGANLIVWLVCVFDLQFWFWM